MRLGIRSAELPRMWESLRREPGVHPNRLSGEQLRPRMPPKQMPLVLYRLRWQGGLREKRESLQERPRVLRPLRSVARSSESHSHRRDAFLHAADGLCRSGDFTAGTYKRCCHLVATNWYSARMCTEPDGRVKDLNSRKGLQDGAAPRLSVPLPASSIPVPPTFRRVSIHPGATNVGATERCQKLREGVCRGDRGILRSQCSDEVILNPDAE